MSLAHKCDISGAYADNMDKLKAYEWTVVKSGKTFIIRLTLDVLDQNRNVLELAPAIWTQVIDEVKARIV